MKTKEIKIEIKNRFTGKVLFEYEKENNTVKDTVIEAVSKGAYLGGADLGGADLRGADLRGAYLGGAYLGGAYLRDAYLRGADLRDAKHIPFVPMACPSDGAFIGWKKVRYQNNKYLVKLEICEDSKRSSSTGTKCRCDKAKVLEIVDVKDEKSRPSEILNGNYVATRYAVGEMVYADEWDENRWEECSHGIHFFINRQEAVEYEL